MTKITYFLIFKYFRIDTNPFVCYLDGVYTFEQEKAGFHSVTPPSQLELDSLLKTIAQRTRISLTIFCYFRSFEIVKNH